MIKTTLFITLLSVLCIGLAMAFQPVDKATSTMKFTGGPEFASVVITTSTMKFTGQ